MTYPVDMTIKPEVQAFFDEATNTISYIVKDPSSSACAIVDSVMDIDYAAGRITYDHADELIRQVQSQGLKLEWIIETHVHADHLSAAPYIQQKLGGKIGIGAKIMVVQETFGKVFNEGTEFQRDGSQFDRLFDDGNTYMVGNMPAFAMYTPGHTPACMVHVMGDAAFVGDTLFMPDGGSARADFYERISLQTRHWSADRRGDHWHSADALAMAWALQSEGALEVLERPVAVELAGTLTRGATVVDWNRQQGLADNASLLMRYDQARFEGLIQAALAAD